MPSHTLEVSGTVIERLDQPLDEGNWPILSASAIPYRPHNQVPKAMDRTDMDMVRDQFVSSVEMADRAGFDMIGL